MAEDQHSELAFEPIAGGVRFVARAQSGQVATVDLELPDAIDGLQALWGAIARHYPEYDREAETKPPTMLETGEMEYQTGFYSHGLAYFWFCLQGMAGVSLLFKPDEARDLARKLVEAADAAEGVVKPRN